MTGENNSPDQNEVPRWWPIVEVVVGGGLFVSIVSVAFGSIWYFATQDARIDQIGRDQIKLEQTVGGLDNVQLGSRLSNLEGQVRSLDQQEGRIETKIDQLLLSRANGNH